MDEIEYKLNTNNSVLIVNAIDKLISKIKSKYKPGERQKFVLENEELKFLREKCSSKDAMVSLTACQGLLALVELGVMEIGQTMSIVVTLLPTAHNHSAIISTMAGLLILDLKSRLVPGQPYKCQFSLKSPQHPFITVLEKNKAEDEVLVQMHALCTHPDYIVSSNSLELLRPVFLWLTCNPRRACSIRPWQLLLGLPQSTAQSSLLLACLSCQQICNPELVEHAFAAYGAVTEAALYRQDAGLVAALLPMLTRISGEMVTHGRDPRPCYSLVERCAAAGAPGAAPLCLALLAHNLPASAALHLHELFARALSIISKYECSNISLNMFAALTLQWLHLPSYLTSSALKVASQIIDTYQSNNKEDNRLHMPNLKANKVFQTLLYTDRKLYVTFKLLETWERVRDNPDKLKSWLDGLEKVDEAMQFELAPFLLGVAMEKRSDSWFEDIVLQALRMVVGLVDKKKEVSVMLLPVLVYKIANDKSPRVKLECLKALPLMAKTKENVPTIVAILNSLKVGKGAPVSFLISLYASLAETQVRCFPYLHSLLAEPAPGRPHEPRAEAELARAAAVARMCEIRPSSHGLELVPTISSILNRSADAAGAAPGALALRALARLWRARCVAPAGTWRALEPKLGRDNRPLVQISLCRLLSEIPALRAGGAEPDALPGAAARQLWARAADGAPEVAAAACDALAHFKLTDYKLKDIPEIYRRSVKLPAAYCKTPADAARKPEDVLDYIPCEVWPEVYKYTNQSALAGVERLCTKLIEREIRAYRSGVYAHDARAEPPTAGYLPAASVARGLLDCFRKQTTSPSYEFPDTVLLSILSTLTAEYPRPLPPLELCFLHEALHRGAAWRAGCVRLAARQAPASASGRRLLENFLQGIEPGLAEESDIALVFELLPILCRGVPPNSLRGPIERCLAESYSVIARTKRGHSTEEPLFVKQLNSIRQALESDKIHDANRTLLSQIVEHYFTVIPDDNVAWPAYVEACGALPTACLERMTSPSGWWELSARLLRCAGAVRAARAARGQLVWLNELIDAQSGMPEVHEYSIDCMIPALQAADRDSVATVEWFLQLMARTQVSFHATEDQSAKQYLCSLVMLTAAILSGHWALWPSPSHTDVSLMMPAATAQLLQREAWQNSTRQMLEWLSHTRDNAGSAATALACQRALLAARHTGPFVQHNIWTRLESYFGKHAVEVDV